MGTLMPSSFVDSFPPIVKLLVEHAPQRVVDIGPGWGKYGLACREYLQGVTGLHALEVRQGRMSTQDAIYDWVYTGDARDDAFGPKFWARWQMALLIDVIEHMSPEEGHRLLAKLLDAGCSVLVSTPKVFVRQHDEHNPYETHLSLWGWEDFGRYKIAQDISTIDAIIFLLVP
jgi:hypothetical protein